MESAISVESMISHSTIRYLAALAIASPGGAHPFAAAAQDVQASQDLDDLIPESAVERPDEWAIGETPQEQESEASAIDLPPPFDEEEVAQLPILDLGTPQQEATPSIQTDPFAEVLELPIPAAVALEAVRIDAGLELAFPVELEQFPPKKGFIERFRQLRDAERFGGDTENISLRAAWIRADRALLERQLRAYGYYDARIWRQVAERTDLANVDSTDQVVSLAVIPGERYRFGTIDLGQLQSAPDYPQLRQTFAILPGDPLMSDRIVDRREALAIDLGESGYPFAQLDQPELLIDHARSEGDLTLAVDPGGKFVFGEITSDKPGFLSARHISRIARFEPGEIYKRSVEEDLRQALLATGLVSSVTITPRPVSKPEGDEAGELAMDVSLEKGRLRTIAGAIGYGTEDGLKLEASWEHRNLFPPEGALKVRGIVGTRQILAGVGFHRNNFRGRDQLLSLDAYASDIETEAVEARTIGLRASFERQSNLLFQKALSWQVGAEALLTDERNRVIDGIARPRQEYLVGSLFGRVTFDRSDSLLDPKQGFRASVFVAPEYSHAFGESVVYARAQADLSAYVPASDSITLAARARVGTIQGAAPFQVAPSRRLYAGGGSSVRGYGYQAVGPRNDLGEPTGGASLVELSAEARIGTALFDGALQVVPFFDLGAVSIESVPDFHFVKYGAGLGIRYNMGFGPIRVDVGVPLNRNPMFDSPVAVYISLGQAF